MVQEDNDITQSGGTEPKKRVACGITEEGFPCNEICCKSSGSEPGQACTKICANFRSWTSLPDSKSLKVTAILECGLYGYGKRISK